VHTAEVRGVHFRDGVVGAMETITVQRPRDVHSQNNILEPQLRAASRFEDNCGSRNCVVAADNVDIFQPNEVVES
jgi:hypothetical protein